jgi:hypothetical protein
VSASTLRAAAALIRQRANAAHQPTGRPPAWHVMQNAHPNTDGSPWGAVEYQRHPAGGSGSRVMVWSGGAAKADAEHIASWHPTVALAVADLIDTVLKVGPVDGGAEWDATVNLARTYLGDPA